MSLRSLIIYAQVLWGSNGKNIYKIYTSQFAFQTFYFGDLDVVVAHSPCLSFMYYKLHILGQRKLIANYVSL